MTWRRAVVADIASIIGDTLRIRSMHIKSRGGDEIVEDARFDAKLTKTDLPGDPVHPRWLFYYYCTHLRRIPDPTSSWT